MLLTGPRFINVEDWQKNTEYIGYNENSKVIVWFWKVVYLYDQ